jgi:hypothetical protein
VRDSIEIIGLLWIKYIKRTIGVFCIVFLLGARPGCDAAINKGQTAPNFIICLASLCA